MSILLFNRLNMFHICISSYHFLSVSLFPIVFSHLFQIFKHSVNYHISILNIPPTKNQVFRISGDVSPDSHGFPHLCGALNDIAPGGWDCPGGRLHPDPQGAATHQGHPFFLMVILIGDYPLVIWFIWSLYGVYMSLYGFDGDFYLLVMST